MTLSAALAAPAQNTLQVGLGGFSSIQAAVDAAAPGDILRIGPGAWAAFTTTKSLRFVAEPPHSAVVLSTFAHIQVTLSPLQKASFDSLLFADSLGGFGGFTCQGGIVSLHDCTIATSFGMTAQNCSLVMRGCTVVAQLASPALTVTNGHLTAVATSFRSLGAPVASLQLNGSRAELSRCEGNGPDASALAPNTSGGPAVALTAAGSTPSQAWLVDSTFVGGASIAPRVGAPAVLAQNPVRTHRCSLAGGNGAGGPVAGVQGQEQPGPLLGLMTTRGDPIMGSTFTTELRGEPGDGLLLYVAFDLLGPAPGSLEQPEFGLSGSTFSVVSATADGLGNASITLPVPVSPSLKYLQVWLRGVDVTRSPPQGSAMAFAVIR